MYFRQLKAKGKLFFFVRWTPEQITSDRGMDLDHIQRGLDEGGWDYRYDSNKTSFKLELIK